MAKMLKVNIPKLPDSVNFVKGLKFKGGPAQLRKLGWKQQPEHCCGADGAGDCCFRLLKDTEKLKHWGSGTLYHPSSYEIRCEYCDFVMYRAKRKKPKSKPKTKAKKRKTKK